jgi:hypothetical protein
MAPFREAVPGAPVGIDARVDANRLAYALVGVATALVVFGVGTNLVYAKIDRPNDEFQRLFDVNAEANIPTWFSTVVLFAVALVIAGIAALRRRGNEPDAASWSYFTALVFVMSLDELAGLHEAVGDVIDRNVDLPVIGGYGWVVAGAAVVVVSALALRAVFRGMPRSTARHAVIAAVVYVTGALGVEVLEAVFVNDTNRIGAGVHVLTGAQEGLEMLGAILALRVLLVHLQRLSIPGSTARTAVLDLRGDVAERDALVDPGLAR